MNFENWWCWMSIDNVEGIHLRQVEDARNRELRRVDASQPRLITLESLVPAKSCGQRINERFELLRAAVASPSLSSQALWKVARAIEEARIEEGRIMRILPALENVSNRGAYFLTCAKGAFLAANLSWMEEEWSDA